MTSLTPGQDPIAAAAERLEQTVFEVKKVIVGQDRVVERLLVCLLAKGHALLEGVPGLAKTLAAETIAVVVGGSFARIQFTPDLLPADVMGTRIYRSSTETFDVELGPVFANFVLADEINRAPAKVQSALLEVMAERQVSIGGKSYPVPLPFLVLATQNPIEQEGVYPLPEAQRDRFLMKVIVDYPNDREEAEIARRMSVDPPTARRVLDPDQLVRLRALCDRHGFFQISGEDINQPRQKFICEAMRDPFFANLYDAAWALIGHERLATESLAEGMFSTETIARMPSLEARIAHFRDAAQDQYNA